MNEINGDENETCQQSLRNESIIITSNNSCLHYGKSLAKSQANGNIMRCLQSALQKHTKNSVF